MQYRELGRTGWKVSSLSFGAWAIGGDWGSVNDTESLEALNRAIEHGVNFFDTADVYGDGRSEQLLARLRSQHPGAFYIATKAGRRLDPHTAEGYNRANLTAFVEGFYNGLIMIPDTVTAYLHQSISPYAKIDSVKIRLDSLGSGNGKFFNTPSGTYYIVIKHRNSIETWSKAGGEAMTKGSSVTYNFTNDSSKAFGNNMKKVNNKWCIYSGDVNQDRYVNLTDITLIGNDAFNYSTGYRLADINGDGYIDLDDLTICDNNYYKSVSTKKP